MKLNIRPQTLWLILFVLTIFEIGNPTISQSTELQTSADASAPSEPYIIGSGDILEIITWKEADFTREVLVRPDGKITFPLLNDIEAAGLHPAELKTAIESKLKKFIEDPVVTIVVKAPVSQKFYVLGEIRKTGEYPLVKGLTVLQAFALAGGFTEWSSKSGIILLRHENGKEKIYKINYKDIIKGKDFSQNIRIQTNDTIIVP